MLRLTFGLIMLLLTTLSTVAATIPEQTLTLKNHIFTPSVLELPRDQRVKIIIQNQDDNAEEFDSADLDREKVIPANSTGFVYVGPLQTGTYVFTGEYHATTAKGQLIVK